MIECGNTFNFDFVHYIREFASDLHGCFHSVDRHQKNPEYRCCHTCSCRLISHVQIFCRVKRVHQSQHSGIGRGIPKSREWPLNQGGKDTAVKTRDSPIGVESSKSDGEGCSISVLVVHRCPHPHERANIESHCHCPSRPSTHGTLGGLVDDFPEGWWGFHFCGTHIISGYCWLKGAGFAVLLVVMVNMVLVTVGRGLKLPRFRNE
mmetsp:Transcript_26298/g.55427  ORF Transcript_26298/g.55427 Transcript_26298/m.55427 type:complete len:206 (-) Transcript_26298:97-714(-)